MHLNYYNIITECGIWSVMSLNGKKIANVYLIIKNPGHPKTFHQPVICACEGGGQSSGGDGHSAGEDTERGWSFTHRLDAVRLLVRVYVYV